MNYHNITHDDMNNGDGLRVVLWVAGCNHHCKNCQNPITWDPDGGIPFTAKEVQEIYKELNKDYISGITFSGGDPFHHKNREEIRKLIQEIKHDFPTKTIWLYTGYTWEEVLDTPGLIEIALLVDVLVDGIYDEALRKNTYPWAGSTNQRVIDVQKTILEGRITLHESN